MKDCNRQSEISFTLCHICKSEKPQENATTKYSLRIASFGDTKTILCRNFGSLTLSNTANQVSCISRGLYDNLIGHRHLTYYNDFIYFQSNPNNRRKISHTQPNSLQDLHLTEINLHEQDQFLLLASKRLV